MPTDVFRLESAHSTSRRGDGQPYVSFIRHVFLHNSASLLSCVLHVPLVFRRSFELTYLWAFYQQIGLEFEEETSKMLHLERGFVWY
jgi:hypothetical protein